jgi:hypothetical protein
MATTRLRQSRVRDPHRKRLTCERPTKNRELGGGRECRPRAYAPAQYVESRAHAGDRAIRDHHPLHRTAGERPPQVCPSGAVRRAPLAPRPPHEHPARQPEKNTPARATAEASLGRLLHAHLTPLKDEITQLREIILAIDKKTNALLPPSPGKTAHETNEKGVTDGNHLRPADAA